MSIRILSSIVLTIIVSSGLLNLSGCQAKNAANELFQILQTAIVNNTPAEEVGISLDIWEDALKEFNECTPETIEKLREVDNFALFLDQVMVPLKASYEYIKMAEPSSLNELLEELIDNFISYSPIYRKDLAASAIKHPKTFKLWTALMAEISDGKMDTTDINLKVIKFAYDEYNIYKERKNKELLGIDQNGGSSHHLSTDDILHNAAEFRSLQAFFGLPQVRFLANTIYSQLDVATKDNKLELMNAASLVKNFKDMYKYYGQMQ